MLSFLYGYLSGFLLFLFLNKKLLCLTTYLGFNLSLASHVGAGVTVHFFRDSTSASRPTGTGGASTKFIGAVESRTVNNNYNRL